MGDETGLLEVEARLKDYISQNLTVITANIQAFSGQAKQGFTAAAVHADGTALAVKTMGKEMVMTGRSTTGLLHLLSGFGIIPPQIALIGGEIGNLGKSMKLIPMLLNPITLGIAAISAAAYGIYEYEKKLKEVSEGKKNLDDAILLHHTKSEKIKLEITLKTLNEQQKEHKKWSKEWIKDEVDRIEMSEKLLKHETTHELEAKIKIKKEELKTEEDSYSKLNKYLVGSEAKTIQIKERIKLLKDELLLLENARKETIGLLNKINKPNESIKADFQAEEDKRLEAIAKEQAKEAQIYAKSMEQNLSWRDRNLYKEILIRSKYAKQSKEYHLKTDKEATDAEKKNAEEVTKKIKEETEKRQQIQSAYANTFVSGVRDLSGMYISIMKQNDDYEYQSTVNKINNSKMTDDQKKKALAAAEAENKKFREKERDAEMAMVLVNAGAAAIKIWTDTPTPLVAAAEIALGIQTAAQLAIMGSQKFARGTRNAPGGWAMVGEEGPEMAYIPQGSQVFTHNETKNMMGGKRNITLNFHGSNLSSRDVVNALRQAERNGELSTYGMKVR